MCVATSKGYVNIEKDFKLDRNEMREECVNSMLDALEEIFEE
jgi:hypothetical protein